MTAAVRHTVFIVDDVPQNVQLAATTLSENGYSIGFATSGREALERIPFVQPDVVLLDVMMPELSGFEVCQQLKQDTRTADIPIIFLTALNDTESIVQGFTFGGVDYVTKPFNAQELLARVRTHCTLHHLQRLLVEKNAILEDLTSTLEAQVAHRTEALHAALRRQQNFGQMSAALVALINHEFRTPMTIIQSSLEMMRYADRMDGVERQQLWQQIHERISVSITTMQRHLDSIALMIQLHTSLLQEKPQLVAPADLIRDVALQCAQYCRRQHSIQLQLGELPTNVIMMPDNFRAALQSIITNAFQYSPPTASVVISCVADESSLTVMVDDEGCGIGPEEEAHLYSWFKRGRAHSNIGQQWGLGLGLPLAKLAAETMMGSLWHERRFPKGTRFVLSVPYGQDLTVTTQAQELRQSYLSNGQPVMAQ